MYGEYLRRPEHNDPNKKWHRVERQYGAFKRQIQLPKGIDHTLIRALDYNGLLTVIIPKALVPEHAPAHIPIQMIPTVQ